MKEPGQLKLGFTPSGECFALERGHLIGGVAILGMESELLAGLLAYEAGKSGMKVNVVDTTGLISEVCSGYIEAYSLSYFMRDCFRVDCAERFHASMMASALASTLGMNGSQEELLSSALLSIALESGDASPVAIFDAVGIVNGFRQADKQEVVGRLAALRQLDSSGEEGALESLSGKSYLVDFSAAGSPELAEAAAAFFVAKLLALCTAKMQWPDIVVISDAGRLFPRRRAESSGRALTCLLRTTCGKVLTSNLECEPDRLLTQGCAVKIFSGPCWNSMAKNETIMPNMWAVRDDFYGRKGAFVPLRLEPKKAKPAEPAGRIEAPASLEKEILEALESSGIATSSSLASWLSWKYERETVRREIERLQREGFITFHRPSASLEAPYALRLTELGRAELKRIERNGEDSDRDKGH